MAPGSIVADDLIDDILEVQCELLHSQVLTLLGRRQRGRERTVPTTTRAGSAGLPLGLPATTGTNLYRGPLPHGPQTAATEISHHERQGDFVILEL